MKSSLKEVGASVAKAAFVAAALLAGTGCDGYHRGAMAGEPKTATYLQVEGARIRYEDTGPQDDPAPVVLVHGFASSLENWLAVTPTLAKKHRVLSMDLKGFGWSDRPEGDYSPAAEAKIVLALMKARGIEKASVVGHSWGSSVVLSMALAAPERVSKIALYDAWVYEEQLPSFFLWARTPGLGEALFNAYYKENVDERISFAFFDQERYITDEMMTAVERSLERPGTIAAALAATRGQRFSEFQDKYRTIKQPTMLLWGREDEVTLLHFGEQLSRELPNARMKVYPRCGHFPMIEAAAESTADLLAFLDGEPMLSEAATAALAGKTTAKPAAKTEAP